MPTIFLMRYTLISEHLRVPGSMTLMQVNALACMRIAGHGRALYRIQALDLTACA